jgi:hypothetical protein
MKVVKISIFEHIILFAHYGGHASCSRTRRGGADSAKDLMWGSLI